MIQNCFHSQASPIVSSVGSLKDSEAELIKSYRCEIDLEFPETEEEQNITLNNIEEIVKNMTASPCDLDFVRGLVQDQHDEEVAFMNFEQLRSQDLRELPWSTVKFEALSLTKGSTILNFDLTFEKPPENLEDVNVYRLMELFILTAIENITFIKIVKPCPSSVGSAHGRFFSWWNSRPTRFTKKQTTTISLKLVAKHTTIDNNLQAKILDHVRGAIKDVIGDSNRELSDQEVEHVLNKFHPSTISKNDDDCDRELSNKEVNRVVNKLASTAASKDDEMKMKFLLPASKRKLIKEFSKLADKDSAKITFQFDSKTKKGKSIKQSQTPSTHWLFPYDFRRLNDLVKDDQMDIMATHTEILPAKYEFKLLTNLHPVISMDEIDSLQKGALGLSPYWTILRRFGDNGGTIGELLKAMDKLKTGNMSQEDAAMIDEYKEKVEKLRDDSFEEILANVYCPSPIPHVQTMEDFRDMYEDHKQKLKTTPMKRFSELQSSPESLREGDQLWIYHKRLGTKSYAHVVIIAQHEKFIHVAAPDRYAKMRSRALICEGDFENLRRDDDLCFVVRADLDRPAIFRERAEACLGIRMDYDAATCNCETFANAVHGEWGPGLQVRKKLFCTKHTFSILAIFRHQLGQFSTVSAPSPRRQN